ncbi:MAG TPA: asparaginase domain-containing protein [Alphaproteobacteria bacterium]|nr:asparaginase domain-containing protein [Alphaproteobacteria bacterium]
MAENKRKITFIATGGTIDSVFHAPSERKVIKQESGIPTYISDVINPHFEAEYKKVIMIDSLDMVDDHRALIVEEINKTQNDRIIITHGTDTMIETARYIEKNIPNVQKTIVLVGSMIPLDGFYQSDAPFNLGFAIAKAQDNPHGIYVCMNGECFLAKDVIKNREIGRFEFKQAS